MSRITRAVSVLLIMGAVWCASLPAHSAVATWSNPAGGDWFDPLNWAPSPPGQNDDVIIDLQGDYSIDLVGGLVNIGSLSLTATGATLVVEGNLTVSGTLDLNGGTLSGGGVVRSDGLMQFRSGAIRGSGALDVYGDIIISSPATKTFESRQMNLHSQATWRDGDVNSSAGTSWTQSEGSLTLENRPGSWTDDGSGSLVIDGGLGMVCCGTFSLGIDLSVNATGSISLASGSKLDLSGGGRFSGNVNTNGTFTFDTGLYEFNPGGVVAGSGSFVGMPDSEVDLQTDINMNGGTWYSYGSLDFGSGRQFGPGSTLRVEGGQVQFEDDGMGTTSLVPTLEQVGGNLTVYGSLSVDTNYVASNGTIGVLGSMTARNAVKSGGSTIVLGTVSFPDGITFSGGSLSVDNSLSIGGPSLQTGGVLGGFGSLDVNGLYTWEHGTWIGNGISIFSAGLNLTGPATKTISAREVKTHGAVTWEDGNIVTSSGVRWSQESGSSMTVSAGSNTWIDDNSGLLIFGGGSGMSCCIAGTVGLDIPMQINPGGSVDVNLGSKLDLSGGGSFSGTVNTYGTFSFDTGLYEFNPGGVVAGSGSFVGMPGSEVDLQTDINMNGGTWYSYGSLDFGSGRQFGPGSTLRVEGGHVQFEDDGMGTTSLVPTLEQVGGNLTVYGSLSVDTNYVASNGTIGVLGSMTARNAVKSGGSTIVLGTVSFPDGITFSGGSLSVDNSLSIGGPSLQTGGVLGGFGSLDVNGLYTWEHGTWIGNGKSLFTGGLTLTSPATKTIQSREIIVDGEALWNQGTISTGDGFSWKQVNGTTTYIPPSGRWIDDGSGEIIIGGGLVAGINGSIVFEPAVQITPSGILKVETGSKLDLGGALVVNGSLDVGGDLAVRSVDIVCGGGGGTPGCDSSVRVSNGDVTLSESLTHDLGDPSEWVWTPGSSLRVSGGVGGVPGEPNGWATIEIAGEDLGPDPAVFFNNFDLQNLDLLPGARLLLLDNQINRTPREALYVDTVTFADPDGRINLNGRALYYNTLIGDPAQIVNVPIVDVSARSDFSIGTVTLNWATNGTPPYRVLRSTFADAGFAEITPGGGIQVPFFEDSALFDGVNYFYLVEELPSP